jgi:phosphonate degradation associated HDIG domain protein
MSRIGILDELETIYAERATKRYGLAAISQLDHALQGAALAVADGEPDSVVVATLLHDVGHMIHKLGEQPAKRGIDDHHEALGAKFLAKHFGADVSEPVRLHVAAKRYLCTVEADYFAKLSEDSVRSLELQGGRMSVAELDAFKGTAYWEAAVKLRRYDEAAKVPDKVVSGFATYRSRIAKVARTPTA